MGLLHGNQVVLEALAATNAGEDAGAGDPPYMPLIWLTQNSVSLGSLPPDSRWILWSSASPQGEPERPLKRSHSGIAIDPEQPLQGQLQQPLR
jgi:hypothetical protein